MSDDLVKGSEFTTVDNYDPAVKARAYDLFLTTDLSMTDIAIDLGVNSKVVAGWARQGKWRDRKKQIEMELFQDAESQYRAMVVKHRVPVMLRHLEVSGKIERAIETVIDDAIKDDTVPSDMKIKRMAEALSSVAAVSARAAGISDRPFSDNQDEEGNKKVPLVVIGVQPTAPIDVQAGGKTINVNPEIPSE